MSPDPIFQVSSLLIYMGVIVFNTIHTIGQALTTLSKPGMYVEWEICANQLGYGLSYARSGIEYSKFVLCD